MRFKRAIISSILGISTFSLLYWIGIPCLINTPKNIDKIENIIYKQSGYKVDLGNSKIHFGFLPSIWFTSDTVSLLNVDNTIAAQISNPKIQLKILPLLMHKIDIENFSTTNELANLRYSKNSKFFLGEYPINIKTKNNKYKLNKIRLNLGKYNVTLNDEKNNNKLSLTSKSDSMAFFQNNQQVQITTAGEIRLNKKNTKYSLDAGIKLPINKIAKDKLYINGSINEFDISAISEYIYTITDKNITSTSGLISINANTTANKNATKNIFINVNTEKLAIKGKNKTFSSIFPYKFDTQLELQTTQNGITIKTLSIDSKNIHAKISGTLKNIGKKIPKYEILAEAKNTRLEDIVNILPWSEKLCVDFNLSKLKQHGFWGEGEAKLKFKGETRYPHIFGYVKLRNAYTIHPIIGTKEGASIDLNFNKQIMKVNVHVPSTNDQYVNVTGMAIVDGSKYSKLSIQTSDNVILENSQDILLAVKDVLKFQLGPVPMMKIYGLGNVSLHSAGTKKDPHIWGKINLKNVDASFLEIKNLQLSKGFGQINFNDKKVSFNTTAGYINNQPVNIAGNCVLLGNLNLYVTSKNQDIQKLLKAINSSPLLYEVAQVAKPFRAPKGLVDVGLQIYGNIGKNAEELVFNKDLFAKGSLFFHNATTQLDNTYLPFNNIQGFVNFDKNDSNYNINGKLRDSKISVEGTATKSTINLRANSNKIQLIDIFDLIRPGLPLPLKKDIGNLYISAKGSYNGPVQNSNIDYNKLIASGIVLSNMNSNNLIKLSSGDFTIKNGILSTSNLLGLLNNSNFNLNFKAKDLDKEVAKITNAKFNFQDLDLSFINSIKDTSFLAKDLKTQLDNISNIKGNANVQGFINNGKLNAKAEIKNISFLSNLLNSQISILSGITNITNNILYISKLQTKINGVPLNVNGKVTNIDTNANLDIDIKSKITQTLFDDLYNNNSVYPIKVKGNIDLAGKLNGNLDNLDILSSLNFDKNSSIYYMGATLEGAQSNTDSNITNPITISSKLNLKQNRIFIKSLNYNQIILDDNESNLKQLQASGEISLLKNKLLGFKNLKIKTFNPMDAKIFNILAKKPIIKQGTFVSDLTINGTSLSPIILGNLNISGIELPVLNSTLHDISIDFQKDFINLNSQSSIIANNILLTAKIKNKMAFPLDINSLTIDMDELDLNTITSALNDIDVDNTRNKQNSTIHISKDLIPVIKDANIIADSIIIKKAKATNFTSHFTLGNDKNLLIDNFKFNLANGEVYGNIGYDLKAMIGKAHMDIANADAQIIAENFFDLTGQMYGTVSGGMNMTCSGLSSIDCVNTLSGDGKFKVTDGRMPKLGSLEYLLKAGNLITSGITGVSINGIIDLITPLKTGKFNSIDGDIHVENGIANDINVYSNGDELNLYLTGKYDLSTLVADMEVYGSISKKIKTLLGKVSNTSLNTLFNIIPGVSINEINPLSTSNIYKIPNFDKSTILRVFKAEIYGDINGSNYVKSFRWVKD